MPDKNAKNTNKTVNELCQQVRRAANSCSRGDNEMYLLDDLISTLAKFMPSNVSVSDMAKELQECLPNDPDLDEQFLSDFL